MMLGTTNIKLSSFILKISKEEIWGTEITPINATLILRALQFVITSFKHEQLSLKNIFQILNQVTRNCVY